MSPPCVGAPLAGARQRGGGGQGRRPPPLGRALWLWQRSAPDGFRFAVKANRFLTHVKRLQGVEDAVGRFLDGARTLEDRLGPVLYQLPPSFHRTPENERRLGAFLELLPEGVQHVLE